MATKRKSKEILKLKYLLIIPLLLSMLIYSSCSSEGISNDEVINYKDLDKKPVLKNTQEADEDKKIIELVYRLAELSLENAINDDVNNYYEINFIIDKNGKVYDIDYSNIPNEYMSTAKKIISSLPEMTAGSLKGKLVRTRMTVLLTTKKEKIEEVQKVDFSQIEKAPIYPGCEEAKDQKQCMSNKITQLVAKSFNVDLAQNLDLKTGKHRISTQFMINDKGEVSDIKVRAPHPDLKEETRRIINLIPKMKPGIQDGKAVNVRYNLPIIFNVED